MGIFMKIILLFVVSSGLPGKFNSICIILKLINYCTNTTIITILELFIENI